LTFSGQASKLDSQRGQPTVQPGKSPLYFYIFISLICDLLKRLAVQSLVVAHKETGLLIGVTMMISELPFKDKIALVTGSGRGIGRAIAPHFARQGADLAVNYFRNRAMAEETVAAIRAQGRHALLVKADIGTDAGLDHLFGEVDRQFGALDILVHNAASGYNRPALQQKPKGWEWTLNINARALLFAAQRAVPLMEKRGGGFIVSISSPGAQRVLPDYVVVGASKAALEALTRYLAAELASQYRRECSLTRDGIDRA
jgi:NADP-dependent 3-hydroxy acid dehydrogenase YdfG